MISFQHKVCKVRNVTALVTFVTLSYACVIYGNHQLYLENPDMRCYNKIMTLLIDFLQIDQ